MTSSPSAAVIPEGIPPEASARHSREPAVAKTEGAKTDGPAPRRGTSHLKIVPETLELRERLKAAAEVYARDLSKAQAFTKSQLEAHGRTFLDRQGQPEKYLGFAMVMIGNFFWKQQFLATPFNRRMLLLPHCLKHAEGCPADYDEFGLDCERCGACSIADYKVKAEQLGYKVLVAEGSPVVLKIIVSGHIDAILGVACLNVLEKAIDKILIAGVPSYAVPLHSGDCKNTTLDEPWVWECLDKYEPLPDQHTQSYVPMMRAANRVFDSHFDEMIAPLKSKQAGDPHAPLNFTETVVYDWLRHGGKRLRPFITLAAYDAMTGGAGLDAPHDDQSLTFPADICRVAMAIEGFHKASLIHDDIQDNDAYRYGQETLHKRYGVGTAINLGDHLIGVGYRLVTACRKGLGGDVVADVLDKFALAHTRLCDGQGAELRWHQSPGQQLTPMDALKVYALKTSPAFEAALYAGIRLAGPAEQYEEMIAGFSRHLGVGFQILNDLQDWQGDDHNKLVAGQDAQSLRPTLLWAMAWEACTPEQQADLLRLTAPELPAGTRVGQLRDRFEKLGVFAKAQALIEKSRARAEALADAVEPEPLRRLLYFIIDTVLAEEAAAPKPGVMVSLTTKKS